MTDDFDRIDDDTDGVRGGDDPALGPDDVVELADADPSDDADDLLVLDELVLPVWEATGHAGVDSALDRLTGLDADDLSGHAAVFADVHQELRQVLADLDG